MAQELANLTCTVALVGNEQSVYKVFKDLTLPARNHVNSRTGKGYTQYGKPELGDTRSSKGSRKKSLTFSINRPKILGNWESDVDRHIQRSIARCNVDVEFKLYDVDRELVEVSD